MKITLKLIALLLSAVMILSFAACGNGDKEASADPSGTGTPEITRSPEGDETADPSPTAAGDTETAAPEVSAEPEYTDVPVITSSPEGEVTAGPTATPAGVTAAPGNTDAAATDVPSSESPSRTSVPSATIAPVVTTAPVVTAAPGKTSAPANTTSPATATPTQAASTPDPNVPHPSEPNDYVANYAGQTVDCSTLNVGDTFFWTLDLINENSCLYAGQWLVEIPSCIEPVSCTDSWSGGLKAAINALWDDEEPISDKPQFVYNIDYDGQTGSSPYGEAGKRYTIIGMYITSFDFGGVQQAGSMVRIKYKLVKTPSSRDLEKDANGSYIPLRVTVLESAAMLTPMQCVTHGTITASDGKLYFKH